MWLDLPPSPSASSMPIQRPAYYEFADNNADVAKSVILLQAASAFSTSPSDFPGARGIVWVVNGHPIAIVQKSLAHETSADVASIERSVPEQLDLIRSQLDISVTQLAELFSVTRKTVYDWYEGQSPRNAKRSERITALVDALDHRHDIDLKRLKGFWNIALSGGSFRATLQSDSLSGSILTAALTEKLDELSAEMSATNRVVRQGATPYTGQSTLADIEHHNDSY